VSELAEDEWEILLAGVRQWGGPATPTAELAVALGFGDVSDLYAESRRLADVLSDRTDLSSVDAVRALVATEIAFGSDVFGAGVEWETVTGLSDEETIAVLRRLQRKLVGTYASLRGSKS
jgi:hypothetical protein